jgi:hypothetical protein
MKLDKKGLRVEASLSDSSIVAMQHCDCPDDRICFYVLVNSQAIIDPCQYLFHDKNVVECHFK